MDKETIRLNILKITNRLTNHYEEKHILTTDETIQIIWDMMNVVDNIQKKGLLKMLEIDQVKMFRDMRNDEEKLYESYKQTEMMFIKVTMNWKQRNPRLAS